MKNIKALIWSVFLATAVLATGCGSLNPLQQAEILKNHRYDVESVNGVKIAGTAAEKLAGEQKAIASLPAILLGIMRKDLPLEGTVNMKVSNPTSQTSNINAFRYLIEIKGKPFFEGTVNQNIRLANGESSLVPLTFKSNLFGVTDEKNGIEQVLSDVFTRQGNGFVVLKIQPSIVLGGRNIYYPGYITVDSDLLKSITKLL